MRWCVEVVRRCGHSPHQNWMVAICPLRARSIPAYAGKYVSQQRFCPHRLVNPRLRGENGYLQGKSDSYAGQSPLAWGKPQTMISIQPDQRLIPTCMGKIESLKSSIIFG